MHCASLTKRDCTPTDNLTSLLEANFGKINEAAILGFKGLHLNELHALNFSTQHIHDRVTHVSHKTGMYLGEFVKLPKILTSHNKTINAATGEPWILTSYPHYSPSGVDLNQSTVNCAMTAAYG